MTIALSPVAIVPVTGPASGTAAAVAGADGTEPGTADFAELLRAAALDADAEDEEVTDLAADGGAGDVLALPWVASLTLAVPAQVAASGASLRAVLSRNSGQAPLSGDDAAGGAVVAPVAVVAQDLSATPDVTGLPGPLLPVAAGLNALAANGLAPVVAPVSADVADVADASPGAPLLPAVPVSASATVPVAAASIEAPVVVASNTAPVAVATIAASVAGAAQSQGGLPLDAPEAAPVEATATPGTTMQAFAAAPGTAPVVVAATAVVGSPVGSAGWNQDMAQALSRFVTMRVENAEIRLHPENLGPIHVRIDFGDDQATVAITAAQPATRLALEQALPHLREMLAQQGVTLGEATVRDDGARQRPWQQTGEPAGGRATAGADATAQALAETGMPARLADARLVDTFA